MKPNINKDRNKSISTNPNNPNSLNAIAQGNINNISISNNINSNAIK